MAFLVMGGYTHASWGNMFIGRIWQGKVVLLAVLVPYIYAVAVSASRLALDTAGRIPRVLLLVLSACGVAAVGASSTAVFLVPLIAIVAAIPLLLRRLRPAAAWMAVALSGGPVAAGVATLQSPVGSRNIMVSERNVVWQQVFSSGWIAALVIGGGLAVLIGAIWPRRWAAIDASSYELLASAAVCGALATLTPMYSLLVRAMGGDAIAYRLAWLVPVPVVVGLVASISVRRVAAIGSMLTIAIIFAVGAPIWNVSNAVHLSGLSSWKIRSDDDLAAARWVVSRHPANYLAANWVTFLVGTVSSGPRPVGTRLDYLETLKDVPGSHYGQRVLLQGIADGADGRRPSQRQAAQQALTDLRVDVACVAWNDAFTDTLFSSSGYGVGFVQGPWTCWALELGGAHA
ncbi:hypothetical protein DDP54_02785 [Cellulomonas sp. WB94]|nr:hypothetical protein DDP54_02785 [Cellulomonas sp. WB94]